jgi:ABC-type glycerol-3-phosphate transport system substrate-binding protein
MLLAGCTSSSKASDAKSSSASGAAVTSSSAAAPSSSSGSDAASPAVSSSAATEPAAPQEKVKLSVVALRPGAEKKAIDAFKAQVADFESKNPNITIDGREYNWIATTFAAQLAAGTVPTVFTIPFTDGKGLIQRKQISDLTTSVKALPYVGNMNQQILSNGQDAEGKIYALPIAAYGNALHYNRKLFKDAGLDPDKPPTTWDEVRAYAKQITDKTGKPGFVQMTKDGTGGWQLAVATYARGGRLENIGADGKATATLDNQGTKDALKFLHDLRWEDKSMGSNFLLNWGDINTAFAAGKVGMYTQGSDVYTFLKNTLNVDPATYGITTLPTTGDGAAVLGGGTLAVVKAGASDAEKQAALKWIDYYYLSKLTNQADAVRDAQALAADKQPIGTPALPIFDKATFDKSLEWIKDYINVPIDQMKGFNEGIVAQTVEVEPKAATQAVYGVLDPVVQAVLTDKNANIDSLLAKANTEAQKAIDKG